MTTFTTDKDDVLKTSFNNIIKLIKDTLQKSDANSFVRIFKIEPLK